ncbi:uncharacterized protein LOC121403011 [Xenopus laevis]|nr:uncharacterized protein LOC121403011 [Xenopus laevis]
MEVRVLSKGLTFVPTNRGRIFETMVDNFKFTRRLRLKEHFAASDNKQSQMEGNTGRNKFKLKGNFDPITNNVSLKAFTRVINDQTQKATQQVKFRDNLSKDERKALKDLCDNKDIIIKSADKGGAVVVLDYAYYRQEILQQLSDASCYQPVMFDPTSKFQLQLKKLLDMAVTHGWILEETRDYLYVEHPHWPLVSTDPDMSKLVNKKLRFGFKRNRNLRELLTPADPAKKYVQSTGGITLKPGVFKCNNCVMCNTLILGDQFFNPHSGKAYHIKHRLTCRSQNVIYIIKCPCGLLYCGKTMRQLRDRISMHRSTIRAALDTN